MTRLTRKDFFIALVTLFFVLFAVKYFNFLMQLHGNLFPEDLSNYMKISIFIA